MGIPKEKNVVNLQSGYPFSPFYFSRAARHDFSRVVDSWQLLFSKYRRHSFAGDTQLKSKVSDQSARSVLFFETAQFRSFNTGGKGRFSIQNGFEIKVYCSKLLRRRACSDADNIGHNVGHEHISPGFRPARPRCLCHHSCADCDRVFRAMQPNCGGGLRAGRWLVESFFLDLCTYSRTDPNPSQQA